MPPPASPAGVDTMRDTWFSRMGGKVPSAAGPVIIRDEALLVAILKNQAVMARACKAPLWKAPESPANIEPMREQWYRGMDPGAAGPVTIRDEALIVAILKNQAVLQQLASKTAEGVMEICPAPEDPDEATSMRNAWFGGRLPGSAGVVAIRDECLIVQIIRDQQTLAKSMVLRSSFFGIGGSTGVDLPAQAPASEAEVNEMAAA